MVCRFCNFIIIPIIALVGIIVFSTQASGGDMYRCSDARGKVSYTNMPAIKQNCTKLGVARVIRLPSASFNTKQYDGGKSGSVVTYDKLINQASKRFGLDANLIRAVIHTESSFNPKDISSTGAQGLMQLMPKTAKEMGVRNPFDPEQNIMGGTRYLRRQLDTFEGDVILSLAAYNAGPTLVKKLGRVPHVDETKRYLKKVISHYKTYRKRYKRS